MKRRSRRNVMHTRKMRKGTFIPQEIMGGLGNRGMQDFFVNLFSPAAKWCSLEGKSDSLLSWRGNVWVFFHERNMMMLSWSKMMLSWRKVHWVFFLERRTKFEWEKKNSMDFPEGQHHFAEGQHLHMSERKKKLKHFLWRTKESLTFLRNYIILPKEKKSDKKILPSRCCPIFPWSRGE